MPPHDVHERLQWLVVAEAWIALLFLGNVGDPAPLVIVGRVDQRPQITLPRGQHGVYEDAWSLSSHAKRYV